MYYQQYFQHPPNGLFATLPICRNFVNGLQKCHYYSISIKYIFLRWFFYKDKDRYEESQHIIGHTWESCYFMVIAGKTAVKPKASHREMTQEPGLDMIIFKVEAVTPQLWLYQDLHAVKPCCEAHQVPTEARSEALLYFTTLHYSTQQKSEGVFHITTQH